MGADAADRAQVRAFLAATLRLAGVAIEDEALAHLLPLVEISLADWPLLTRAARSTVEPMAAPARREAGS